MCSSDLVHIELRVIQVAMRIDQFHDWSVGWRVDWSVGLLQSCPHRHVFEEACQHRQPTFERRRDDHALRLNAAQLPRREVRDDHNLTADERFRLAD